MGNLCTKSTCAASTATVDEECWDVIPEMPCSIWTSTAESPKYRWAPGSASQATLNQNRGKQTKPKQGNSNLCQLWSGWERRESLLSPDLMPGLPLSSSRAFYGVHSSLDQGSPWVAATWLGWGVCLRARNVFQSKKCAQSPLLAPQLPFSLPRPANHARVWSSSMIPEGIPPSIYFCFHRLWWQASVTLRNSSLCCLLTAFTEIGKTDLFLQHSPTEFTSQRAGNSNEMVQFQSSLIPSGSYWKKFLSPVTPLQSMLKGSALLYVDSGRKHCSLWYLERFYFTSARPEAFFGWNQSLNSEEKRAHQRTGIEFNN